MVDIKIRRAEKNDLDAINRILYQVGKVHSDGRPDLFIAGKKKYTDEELLAVICNKDMDVFVAIDEQKCVCGYSICVHQQITNSNILTPIRTLYIDDLCVEENERGKHVGSAIYRYVVDYARENGFYNVTLNVWSCNSPAMRFYERMGMTPYKVGMEQIL